MNPSTTSKLVIKTNDAQHIELLPGKVNKIAVQPGKRYRVVREDQANATKTTVIKKI